MADTASPSGEPLDPFRLLEPDFVPDPAHAASLEAEFRKTLEEKAQGRMTYRSLEDVARKFGANAR